MHFLGEQHSIAASNLGMSDQDPEDLSLEPTPKAESDKRIDNFSKWSVHIRSPHDPLSSIALRPYSQEDSTQHHNDSLRSFRERADALSFKLAVMTALAKQAHREARILEQQFLVQKSLATLNRQNALTRENNRKTSERLHGLIRRAEAALKKHCRPPCAEQETACAAQ